jgi:pimeloyl-ACP methyl ester carboxylesterase
MICKVAIVLALAGAAASGLRAQDAPRRTDRFSGTWQGRLLGGGDGPATAWTLVQGRDGTGSLTLDDGFLSRPTRTVLATGDSLAFELLRPLAGPDSLRLAFGGHVRGDSLAGVALVQRRGGRPERRPFHATRVAPLPAYEPAECMFPDRPLPSNAECGWLVVPESRSRPLGATVRIAVMRGKALRPSGKPPLVFLHGGPGERSVQAPPPGPPPPSMPVGERDIILFDQRASGYSEPTLCPEYNDSVRAGQRRLTGRDRAAERPWIAACVTSLRARGIDPDAYNTSTSAHDVADLRRALGYERWIIRGGSYGTRLAQEVMRADPLGIGGVILIGPAPAEGGGNVLDWRLRLERTLRRLLAACDGDAACHQAFPDPMADLIALQDELARAPLLIPTADGRDTVVLHADRLVPALATTLDGTGRLRRIPLLLHELRRGDRMRAARMLAPTADPQAGLGAFRALNQLVNCYEPTELSPRTADSLNALLLPLFRLHPDPDACALWRTRFATAEEVAPVRSDLPALILAGEFDARTPMEGAYRIARTLTRAYVHELPATGHIGEPPCMRELIGQFLEEPERAPDASCVARMPPVSFRLQWDGPP